MGKREQMIRVLLSAAASFGFDVDAWAGSGLESVFTTAVRWVPWRFPSGSRAPAHEAWIYTAMRLEAEMPEGCASDIPRAGDARLEPTC